MIAARDRDRRVRAIVSGSSSRGAVRLPPSKSVTNRALNLALIAETPVEIVRPLDSEDIRAMLEALERLGYAIERLDDGLVVRKERAIKSATIDCRASGTMLRFLTAALSTKAGTWTLDGTERLRRRPLGPLIQALRELGVRIECLESEGFAPVRIEGGTLFGGRCELDAGASSQYLSALLMAGVGAQTPVSIRARELTSAPYVELTRRAMAQLGWTLQRSVNEFSVAPQQPGGRRFEVEADYSSACYFGAAAALTGGVVELDGLQRDSGQGDARFFSILQRMGARCDWIDGRLVVAGAGPLSAVTDSCADIPDQVPTLAVLAPFAAGTTRISDVAHLRLKESDRLRVVAGGLAQAGVESVVEEAAALAVPGVWARRRPPDRPVTVDTADDHRIAMSFAVLGLRRPGVSIADPAVVAKSYPGFWDDFRAVCEP